MEFLLAWLMFNAIFFVWRLAVTTLQAKTELQVIPRETSYGD